MTKHKFAYLASTTLVVIAFAFGGFADLARTPDMVAAMQHLGYPEHLLIVLGIWKLLGALAIAVPRLPILKEWAYAGMTFDLTGAAVAHTAVGDPASNVIVPLVLLGLVLTSWALRPEGRRLPSLAPATLRNVVKRHEPIAAT